MAFLFPDGVSPATAWLILAVVLAAAEIAMPGVFLIWIAAAAAVTALLAAALPIGITAQIFLFAALCAVCVYFGRRWYLQNPQQTEDPLLNNRGGRLVGERVEVVEAIKHGSGRVRVGDGVWTARGPDCPAGAIMRVTGVHGSELDVEPAEEPPEQSPKSTLTG